MDFWVAEFTIFCVPLLSTPGPILGLLIKHTNYNDYFKMPSGCLLKANIMSEISAQRKWLHT